MICLQVVYLLLEELGPEVLAYELDGLKMITEPWPLLGVPKQEVKPYNMQYTQNGTKEVIQRVSKKHAVIRQHEIKPFSSNILLLGDSDYCFHINVQHLLQNSIMCLDSTSL